MHKALSKLNGRLVLEPIPILTSSQAISLNTVMYLSFVLPLFCFAAAFATLLVGTFGNSGKFGTIWENYFFLLWYSASMSNIHIAAASKSQIIYNNKKSKRITHCSLLFFILSIYLVNWGVIRKMWQIGKVGWATEHGEGLHSCWSFGRWYRGRWWVREKGGWLRTGADLSGQGGMLSLFSLCTFGILEQIMITFPVFVKELAHCIIIRFRATRNHIGSFMIFLVLHLCFCVCVYFLFEHGNYIFDILFSKNSINWSLNLSDSLFFIYI